MKESARGGSGVHFHAQGSIDEYSQQLADIFAQITGKRSVELIQ